MTERSPQSEAIRLEDLWAGEFGDAYVARNAALDERRLEFWRTLLGSIPVTSVLEVGCGQGGNLRPIASILQPAHVWGVDVNTEAIDRARRNAPGVNAVHSVARNLPFRDGWFGLVFTMGVLIHQPDDTLPRVMTEIVRCASRFVLWGEYDAATTVEVAYHGARGALFKRDYGGMYASLFPELTVRSEGFLGTEEGFDRVAWQLLEKA